MTARPRFITLEGIEGVGKSTQLQRLVAWLRQHDIPLIDTREPGGSPVGNRIRELLLTTAEAAPAAETELLLMFAARAEHLNKTIEPALAAGNWVISDRFTDASYAYQGGGRGIPAARIETLEHWVQGARQPDRTLLFDAPVEQALTRARGRGPADRFEQETQAFFERVREAYLDRVRANPDRFRIIDASGDIDAVSAEVQRQTMDLLPAGLAR